MADSWRTRPSRQRQMLQTQRQQSPGMTLALREAAPIPPKTDIEPEAGGGGGAVWVDVQANPPPSFDVGSLWFVTDEPVT